MSHFTNKNNVIPAEPKSVQPHVVGIAIDAINISDPNTGYEIHVAWSNKERESFEVPGRLLNWVTMAQLLNQLNSIVAHASVEPGVMSLRAISEFCIPVELWDDENPPATVEDLLLLLAEHYDNPDEFIKKVPSTSQLYAVRNEQIALWS